MAFLTRLLQQRPGRSLENPSTSLASPDDWLWDALGAVRASSGVNVNRETALTYAAWWRGVNLISRDVAKLPVHVFCRGEAGKVRDTKHPAYQLLRRQPNREMTAFHFRQTMQMHVLSGGNGYAYIDRAGDGSPLELIPLQPQRTYPVRTKGKVWYITELTTGEPRKLPAEDILHIKGLSFDGLIGYSVITKARESLGLGMGLDSYGSTIFRNGAAPGIVLEHPAKLSPEATKNLRESWERMHAGLENAHKTAILSEGMKANKLGMSAKDAQLLDERKFQVREVALWFGIPPHKLGAEISTSYGSLEQENQDYLDSAIDPWLVNWEQELDLKLLTDRQIQTDSHLIEFDRKALIRANMGERSSYYHNGLADGWLNRDEVRSEEGFNPIPDGAGRTYFVPLNMGKAGGEDELMPDASPAGQQEPGELLDVPDIRQPDHYSCGACAAMTVGQYFGVGPDTLQEWKDALGTEVEQSTKPFAIADYLARLGLVVTTAHNLTIDDLKRCWKAGQPVICPVQDYGPFLPGAAHFDYGHYLTVIGCTLGYVFCQDSSADNVNLPEYGSDATPGRVMIAEQKWLENWRDTDIDGNTYIGFGIIAGKEILPGADDDGKEDLDTPADEAVGAPGEAIKPLDQPAINTGGTPDVPLSGDSPARQQIVAAHQRLLGDVCRRMAKRIGLHARRHAKEPKAFMRWLDSFQGEHIDVVTEAMTPVLDALALVEGRARDSGLAASDFLIKLRSGLLDLSGRCTARQLAAEVDRYMREQERCGGKGGDPGPCPEGKEKEQGDKGKEDKPKEETPKDKKEDKKDAKDKEAKAKTEQAKEEALEKDVKQLQQTPEGREQLAKGEKAASKATSLISSGVKKALDTLDAETKGAVSLIAGGLKTGSPKMLAAGAAHAFNSVFQSVHQEVYENALSQHSIPGAHAVGMIAASVAVKAEQGVIKGVAWAWNKATGKQAKSFRSLRMNQRDDLGEADKQLLDQLAAVAVQSLKDVYQEAGVELTDDDIDMDAVKNNILAKLQENKAAAEAEGNEE